MKGFIFITIHVHAFEQQNKKLTLALQTVNINLQYLHQTDWLNRRKFKMIISPSSHLIVYIIIYKEIFKPGNFHHILEYQTNTT